MKLASALVFLFALSFGAFAKDALAPIPPLTSRVTDVTATLSAEQRQKLETTLAELEARKGAQLVVLIIGTTGAETMEAYATRVFAEWKLGRKEVDDGVLIVVAKKDRVVRIEVAYGLEGAIPDAAAKRIAHDYMSARFVDGDFAGGVTAGVNALIALIDDEPLPAPPPSPTRHNSNVVSDWWSPAFIAAGLILGGVIGVFLILVFSQPRVHRAVLARLPERMRPYAIGVLDGLLVGILLGNPLAGVTAFAAGTGLGAVTGIARTPSRRRGGGGGGGSSSGDSGGSSSSSSGGSSGGFSGGGGSSGGGGASDRW
ncbi:MAG: TPM domain-containing protein [Rhodanobacteraceae bacterium]